jgi:hypothetical protein
MTPELKRQLIVGGIGGLTPFVAIVLVSDAATIERYVFALRSMTEIASLHIIGYALKAPILFAVGAFWAFLHRSDRSLLKIYQLGIVAPAIITGSIEATNGDRSPAPVKVIYQKEGWLREFAAPDSAIELAAFAVPSDLRDASAAQRLDNLLPVDFWSDAGHAIEKAARDTGHAVVGIQGGLLSRPLPQQINCPNVNVGATVPSSLPVTVIVRESTCVIVVGDAREEDNGSTRVKCSEAPATLYAKGLSVSVAETGGRCTFSVSQP